MTDFFMVVAAFGIWMACVAIGWALERIARVLEEIEEKMK